MINLDWKGAGLAFFAVTTCLTSGFLLKAEREIGRLEAVIEVQKKDYEDAQTEYEARAVSEKNRIEAEGIKNAEEADRNYDALLSKYNASLVRYEAAQRTSSRTNLSLPSSSASSIDRSSIDPEVPTVSGDLSGALLITMEDAQICAINTVRVIVGYEWAKEQ